jgi:hypothetical protein
MKKIRLFPMHAMKAYGWSGHIGPLIVSISSVWRPLYPCGKKPWNPINRRLCDLQSKSGDHIGDSGPVFGWGKRVPCLGH